MQDWQTTITYTTPTPFTPDDTLDFMERHGELGTVATLHRDGLGGSFVMSITATTPMEAIHHAANIMHADSLTASIAIIGVEAISEAEADERLAEPTYPPVVGYAEIARMADVSRQRARMFPHAPRFPKPVITTAQGPLFNKHAVEAWLRTRIKKAGRPAKKQRDDNL